MKKLSDKRSGDEKTEKIKYIDGQMKKDSKHAGLEGRSGLRWNNEIER